MKGALTSLCFCVMRYSKEQKKPKKKQEMIIQGDEYTTLHNATVME